MGQPPRMHPDEINSDAGLVLRLIAEQHPRWSSLTVAPVLPRGTDNALYRLGTEMVVRLPRREANVPALRTELEWLPRLAPQLPLAIPEPVATGVAGSGFPFPWAVYRWIHGLPAPPLPRCPGRGRGDLDARPRLGTLAGAHRAWLLLARDERGARRGSATLAGRGPRRAVALPEGDGLGGAVAAQDSIFGDQTQAMFDRRRVDEPIGGVSRER